MDQLEELKQFTTERFRNHKAHPPRHALPDVPVKLRTQLNLFLPDHEMHAPAVWFEFKRWVDRTYRAYLKEAHGVRNVNELKVLARCIPVCYQKGMRAHTFKNHPERQRWAAVDVPKQGDAVLMRQSRHPVHVGVWVDADSGGVLHCAQQIGVVFQQLSSLASHGWQVEGYCRRRLRHS